MEGMRDPELAQKTMNWGLSTPFAKYTVKVNEGIRTILEASLLGPVVIVWT